MSTSKKRTSLWLSLIVILLLLGGAGWYLLWPVSVSIPLSSVESTLAQSLSQKPLNWNHLLTLELAKPKITAAQSAPQVAGQNQRLRVELAGTLRPPLLQAYQGQVELETGLNYKPATGEFFLVDPQVKQLQFEALPANFTQPLKDMANQLLPPVFGQIPVYRLNSEQLPERALKKMLMAVSVQQDRIKIVFQNRYLHQLLSRY